MLLIVFDPLDGNTIGSTKSSEMAKPLEERSDEDLQRGLAEGEFGEKKAAWLKKFFAAGRRRKLRI